ncbi:segregation/condensation protein A [Robertmurraya sp. DFI.2.37]|uniref:segregation/condensation protein A n=1 Tax=Robertmurraya sp. DFI.2.37 TaxID=3031819 RepID=UPI0012469847|nr:segregation/condensation protein A [Robertmurraya sp. DFI.2.37]MDF1507664.1 segregation/condensation protein A [Robertmurraya sp. DFI.2.37]
MEHYNVKIDAFEGPLDLLLHLINRLEIDIYDIPVSEITEQYLFYIHTMKELQLDVASEYLVMAATLLAIKSKMLLPKHEESLEDEFEFEYEEDPRDELVERLIEYRKYKEAASDLKSLELERGLMFTKPPSDLADFSTEVSPERRDLDVSLYDMLGALQKLLRRKKLQRPLPTKISRQEIPIEQRMDEILRDLQLNKGRRSFFDLFPRREKDHIVITFLAVLELMKRREIIVEQEGNFSEIFVMGKE